MESNLSVRLKDSLDRIIDLSDKLIKRLVNDGAHIYTPGNVLGGIKYIELAIFDFFYQSSGDGRETTKYIAVVKCSKEVIERIREINVEKDNFSTIKKDLDSIDRSASEFYVNEHIKTSRFRERLSNMGLSRLSVNQVKRHIPFYDGDVTSITYSHYKKGRTLVKITPEKCDEKLLALSGKGNFISEHIEYQRNLVGNHPHNIELVVARKIPPCIKVNISNSGTIVKTICPSLPIFICEINDISISFFPKITKERRERSDKKIEDKPFLPSIHVYRKIPK